MLSLLDPLRRLTDPTLKRLYKFALKKLVGKYLACDLQVEQLVDVRLRAGVLELQDLAINADAINDHLVGQPFRLKRGTIKALRVTICYEKILSESFTVSLEGVELEIVPATDVEDTSATSTPRGSPTPMKEPRRSPAKDSSTVPAVAWPGPKSGGLPSTGVPYELRGAGFEDADELDIIAEWIQLIKARIKVSVRDLKLRLYDYEENGATCRGSDVSQQQDLEPQPTCVCVTLYSAMYYDKTPDHFAPSSSGGLGSSTLSASIGPPGPSPLTPATPSTGSAVPFAAGAIGSCVSHKGVNFTGLKIFIERGGGTSVTVFESELDGLVHLRIGQRHRPADMAKLDVQVFLKKMQGVLSPKTLEEMGRVGRAVALGSAGGKGRGELAGDQLVEQDGPPNAELDFRKLELLIQEMAKAKAAGQGAAAILGSFLRDPSSLSVDEEDSDSVEFFDCQEPVESPPGPKPSPKTALRLRFHLGEFAFSLYETDQGMMSRQGTALKAHLRDLSVVTVAGGAKASVEFSVQEIQANEELVVDNKSSPVVRPLLARWVEEEEEERPSPTQSQSPNQARPSPRRRRRSRRSSSSSSSSSSSAIPTPQPPAPSPSQGPFLKASMELIGEQAEEDLSDGSTQAKTVKISLEPFRTELPLTSIRRWIAIMSPPDEGPQRSAEEKGASTPKSIRGSSSKAAASNPPTRTVVSCPSVFFLLPFSESLLEMPSCQALRHALVMDEVEKARWVGSGKVPNAKQAGFTFLLNGVRMTIGGEEEEEEGGFKVDWQAADVFIGFGEGRVLEVLKVGQRKTERSFFRSGCYGDAAWKKYASSLEEKDTPDLSAWETVDRDGGLLRIEPRGLPTSKAVPLTHLHLADVSMDLTKVEKMAMMELVGGVLATDESAVTEVQEPVEANGQIVGSPFLMSSGDALLVVHETTSTLEVEEDVGLGGGLKEPKAPLTYTAVFEGLCIYSVGLRSNGSHFRAASADVTLTESENCSNLAIMGRCHSQHKIWGGGLTRRLSHQPLVYKNKWATTPASTEALIVLDLVREGDVSFPGAGPGPLSVYLDFRSASFRYQVDSAWIPRLASVIMSGPETLPWNSKEEEEKDSEEVDTVQSTLEEAAARLRDEDIPPPPTMTKLFCTALDTTVDYRAGLDSRTVINVVFFRISSNLVGGAGLQGYKIMAQDLALHMINQGGDYSEEDAAMVGSYLILPDGDPQRSEEDEDGKLEDQPGSAHQHLEKRGFVQLATLNFVDAFVRCQVGGPPKPFPMDPMVNVELSMGLLHVYTCGDSLQTLEQTFGDWWARITDQQQQQPQPTLPLLEAGRQTSSSSIRTNETTGTVSLEPMIKEDKFVPEVTARPVRASSSTSQSSSGPSKGGAAGLASCGGLDLSKVMLVEDYYTVGQQEPPPLPVSNHSKGGEVEDGGSCRGSDDGPEWQGGWIAEDGGSLRGILGRDEHDGGFLLEVMEDEGSVVTELEDDDDNLSVMSGQLPDVPVWKDDDDGSEFDEGAVPGSLFKGDMNMELEMDVMGPQGLSSSKVIPCDDDPLTLLAGMEAEAAEEEDEDEDEAAPEAEEQPLTPPMVQAEAEEMQVSKSEEDEDTRIWRDHLPNDTEWQARWLVAQSEDGEECKEVGQHMGPIKIYPHHIPQAVEDISLPFASRFDPFSPSATGSLATGTVDLGHIQFRLVLHDLSVRWRVFGGHDWPRQKLRRPSQEDGPPVAIPVMLSVPQPLTGPHPTPSEGRSKKLLENLLEDYGAPAPPPVVAPKQPNTAKAIYPPHRPDRGRRTGSNKLALPSNSSRQVKGGRDSDRMVELCLRHVYAKVDTYDPQSSSELASSTLLTIKDLHVVDRINSLPQRKILGYWRDDASHPREIHQKMLDMKLVTVRACDPEARVGPVQPEMEEEQRLQVRLLPLRVYVDQHTIQFIMEVFGQSGKEGGGEGGGAPTEQGDKNGDGVAIAANNPIGVFFQFCEVRGLKVKLDYQPKTIDVRAIQAGNYAELINLFPLRGVELSLGAVRLKGVTGWPAVLQGVVDSWLLDVTHKQLHKFLTGSPPIRSVVNIGSGMADLVLVPLQQYRKDKKLLRGIRKGTLRCLKGLTLETLHASHKLTKVIASTLDDLICGDGKAHGGRRARLTQPDFQPKGVRESLEHAYDSLSKGLGTAAQTIIAIPLQELERTGPKGSVKAVIRALPIAVVKPVVGATEALSYTLLGMRNRLAPDVRREEEEMWRCA